VYHKTRQPSDIPNGIELRQNGKAYGGSLCTKVYSEISNRKNNLRQSSMNTEEILKSKDTQKEDNDKETCTLTEEEMKQYGNRFITNYTKGSPLGKGGQGVVFKATDNNNMPYAVKQIT